MEVLAEALTQCRPASIALGRVAQIDLSDVRSALAEPEDGEPVPEAMLDVLECEYRKFLALHLAYPDVDVVPCRPVDRFWHAHILDTQAYVRDCTLLFGRYLHHDPYFGRGGEEGLRRLDAAYERTISLYVANFGDPPQGTWPVRKAAKCRTKCKPVRCK